MRQAEGDQDGRIKFQSSMNSWGCSSVGSNGATHEFAESQFDHIIARGKDCKQACKNLGLVLEQLEVVGEARFPGEYVVEPDSTEVFKDNIITTSRLNGFIKQMGPEPKYNNRDVVFYAAGYGAMDNLKEHEITFERYKYESNFCRIGPDQLPVTIGDTKIACRIQTQADKSIFVSVGSSVMKVAGQQEAPGMRLRLAGSVPIMIPMTYDPGATVEDGEPYVEREDREMTMPTKASAPGKIS